MVISRGTSQPVDALDPDTPVVIVYANGDEKRATREIALEGAKNGVLDPDIVAVHQEID